MNPSTVEIYQLKYLPSLSKREAIISFVLSEKSKVLLKINNENDIEVRLMLNEILNPADYEINFLFGALDAGVYTIKLIVQTENIIDINSLNIQIP